MRVYNMCIAASICLMGLGTTICSSDDATVRQETIQYSSDYVPCYSESKTYPVEYEPLPAIKNTPKSIFVETVYRSIYKITEAIPVIRLP